MTSSRLTSVAADMRAKAKAATTGPWRYEAAPDGFPPMVIGNDMVVADTFDKPDMPDAAYIAAMHPAVALALADWLDRTAELVQRASLYAKGVDCKAALALCDAYEGSVDMRAKGES